jgi:hypothetical protein
MNVRCHIGSSMTGRRWTRCLAGAILLVTIAGCARSNPHCIAVSGQVTYQGKQVKAGMIAFTRLEQAAGGGLVRPATADLQADGSYAMTTFREGDGALPGEYAVSIVSFDYSGKRDESQRLPSMIPAKYGSPETSGLNVRVPSDASGPLRFDFDLTD